MYEEFFSLAARPFSKTPDPRFLYPSRSHEEALARLQFAVEEREFIVLTGEVGCGKTTLTRALIDTLDERFRVIMVINPKLSGSQFLRVVARHFDIELANGQKDDLLDAIYEKVYADYENGITPVVIIDEGQLIPGRETFEEIRLLTNFQLDDSNLLSLVLVGQPELRNTLCQKQYLPIRQRVGLFYHLGAIGPDEMKQYIEHRLSIAGRDEPLFTEEAVTALFRFSGGVPRVINSIANTALLEGFGVGLSVIDEHLVEEAARELGLDGYRIN